MKQKQQPKLPQQNVTTSAKKAQVNAQAQELVEEFFRLLYAHRQVFKQTRSFGRCGVLALGMIFAFARHTVSQCVLSLGLGGRDWSGWYRQFTGRRYKQEDLDEIMLGKMLEMTSVDEPFVTVIDGTQTPHTSKNMPGVGWGLSPRSPKFMRSLHLCRRWVTCAWLPKVVDGFSRAIPLKFLPAFTPKSARAEVNPRTESQTAQIFLGWLRGRLDEAKRYAQQIVVLVDGAFDTKEMWRDLPQRTVMIVRTAKNRVLHELPGAYIGKGRPKVYGERTPPPEAYLHNRHAWKQINICVRGAFKPMRFKLYGAFIPNGSPGSVVYLLIVDTFRWKHTDKNGRRIHREREEAFYLISAVKRNGVWELPFPVEMILMWVWQRWEVEVTHRDMKAGFGIGQIQCWGTISSVMATQWAVWVFSLMLLAAYRAWGWQAPFALNCSWWRGGKRWSFNTVWRYFRIGLWNMDTFRAFTLDHRANTQKRHSHLGYMLDSALAAARA